MFVDAEAGYSIGEILVVKKPLSAEHLVVPEQTYQVHMSKKM